MKNRMQDVRDHLVAQMERLGEPDATAEDVAKAKGISDLAARYTETVKVEIHARELAGLSGEQLIPESLERPALPHGRS